MNSPHSDSSANSAGKGTWFSRINELRSKPWWPWTRRILALAFFALVAGLLIYQAKSIEWGKVAESMRAQSAATLAIAGLLALTSHVVYSSFDLFGRRVTGHELPTLRVMATTFVSYVFNLNLGTLIGGLAFRYRLYSRQGLPTETTTTVIATSMLTNWLGFVLLGGLVMLFHPPKIPQDWPISGSPLWLIGAVMLALALAWLLACVFSKRREWNFGETAITLPDGKMALLQFVAAATNWALMGGIVFVLLGQQIDYFSVLTTLMIGAVAGLIARVPAGLGVLEAVFVGLLGSKMASTDLIGGLLLYRSMYYLAPLGIALLLQWWVESNASESDAGIEVSAKQSPEVAVSS